MTKRREPVTCGKCDAELPRRPVQKLNEQIPLFGVYIAAVVRVYVCRECGNRHAQIDARY